MMLLVHNTFPFESTNQNLVFYKFYCYHKIDLLLVHQSEKILCFYTSVILQYYELVEMLQPSSNLIPLLFVLQDSLLPLKNVDEEISLLHSYTF